MPLVFPMTENTRIDFYWGIDGTKAFGSSFDSFEVLNNKLSELRSGVESSNTMKLTK